MILIWRLAAVLHGHLPFRGSFLWDSYRILARTSPERSSRKFFGCEPSLQRRPDQNLIVIVPLDGLPADPTPRTWNEATNGAAS